LVRDAIFYGGTAEFVRDATTSEACRVGVEDSRGNLLLKFEFLYLYICNSIGVRLSLSTLSNLYQMSKDFAKEANKLSPRSTRLLEDDENIYVVNRLGKLEVLDTNRITSRIKSLTNKKPVIRHVNASEITLSVCAGLKSGITTYEIDEYAANKAASMALTNPAFLKVAARIAIDNHQKNTMRSFVDKMKQAYMRTDSTGAINPIINKEFYKFVEEFQDVIERCIDYERDFNLDFFGFRTFQRLYSITIAGKPIERPQDLFMRTAIALHHTSYGDVYTDMTARTTALARIKETYDALSTQIYTQASPTYFNAGTNYQQFSSCFLLGTEDSLSGIMKTATDCAQISKMGGGIGVHINNWRSAGMRIRGTNGTSNGVGPFLKIYNSVITAFNQGGRRLGSAAIYLAPHHPDIMTFLELKRNTGSEEMRARDLFYAVWLSDEFMRRVKDGADWCMFDPDECRAYGPDLSDLYGEEYERHYKWLEENNKYIRKMPARDIWKMIVQCNQETGMPYICFSDNVNRLSNQKNIGTIKSSNLCVSGDTLILTRTGHTSIKRLTETENGRHDVWNGYEFAPAIFAKTGENRQLYLVSLSDGSKLECTANHEFMVVNNTKVSRVPAERLRSGDTLLTCSMPVIDNYQATIAELNELAALMLDVHIEFDPHGYHRLAMCDSDAARMLRFKLLSNVVGINVSLDYYDENPTNTIIFGTISTADTVDLYNHGFAYKAELWDRLIHNQVYAGTDRMRLRNNFRQAIITGRLTGSQAYSVRVSSVSVSGFGDTYCFNEGSLHVGVFNGILAGNCSEIVEYSDANETAVCNLCSISLSKCVIDEYTAAELELPAEERRDLDHEFPVNPRFDFAALMSATKQAVRNLNNIIDINHYPTPETKRSNVRHRPIGIGVQGLADAFLKLRYAFDSEPAAALNKRVFETMYFAALSQSTRMARELYAQYYDTCDRDGVVSIHSYAIDADYHTYEDRITTYTNVADIPRTAGAYSTFLHNGGCPLAHGKFHWELAGLTADKLSGMYDWETLRDHIQQFGVRNSLLLAVMPTASTSQLMGNNECIEPYTSQIYKRTTLAGNYIVINKYLMKDLHDAKLWSNNMREYLLHLEGSIQSIEGLPQEMKDLYKTSWEIKPDVLVKLAIERQPFIDQAQSLNLYMENFSAADFTRVQFAAWRGGLKTGKYYIHTRPAVMPTKFTIDQSKQDEMKRVLESRRVNTEFMEDKKEVCDLCSA